MFLLLPNGIRLDFVEVLLDIYNLVFVNHLIEDYHGVIPNGNLRGLVQAIWQGAPWHRLGPQSGVTSETALEAFKAIAHAIQTSRPHKFKFVDGELPSLDAMKHDSDQCQDLISKNGFLASFKVKPQLATFDTMIEVRTEGSGRMLDNASKYGQHSLIDSSDVSGGAWHQDASRKARHPRLSQIKSDQIRSDQIRFGYG